MSLLVHCGAEKVNWDRLTSVKTPESTDTHVPIPHHELVERVREEIPNTNLIVKQEEHALSKDGMNYFGVIRIEDPKHPAEKDGFSRVIGLRNSHNKRLAVGLVSGSSVFVCDNLAFSGEITVTRKHTSLVMDNLNEMIATALNGLQPLLSAERQRMIAYRSHNLETDEHEVDHILMEMLRKGAITGSQITKAWNHWVNPPHKEFEERTLWSLFNSATHAYKGTGMRTLFQRSKTLHNMCDDIADFEYIDLEAKTDIQEEVTV